MTPFFIAFIMAAGVSTWVYTKSQRRTGNNTSSSVTIASVIAVMVFILTLMLLKLVDGFLES